MNVGNDKPVFTSQPSQALHVLAQGANKRLCHNCYLSDWVDLLILPQRVEGKKKQHRVSQMTGCQLKALSKIGEGGGHRTLTGKW